MFSLPNFLDIDYCFMTHSPDDYIVSGTKCQRVVGWQAIRDAFEKFKDSGLDLNIPRIAVLGCKGAGKSSVIESIVGFVFLPRGGILCPVEVRLVRDPDPTSSNWGVFASGPEQVMSADDIREEINRRNESLQNEEPILLTIHSMSCLELTLIDLPEMSVDKSGDERCREYICDPQTIILAVFAADEDFSSCETLKMAQSADPDGTRTFGFSPLVDVIDSGANVPNISLAKNSIRPRGFVAVINGDSRDEPQRLLQSIFLHLLRKQLNSIEADIEQQHEKLTLGKRFRVMSANEVK